MISFNDTMKLATRMFRTRPARTWLTILGLGVGIAAVVILVGLGYGLQKILLETLLRSTLKEACDGRTKS